jgi:zinc/manganese transport system permease protein
MTHLWSELFSFANYGELLVLVRNSILAGAVLGLAGGLVGVFVMARDLPFAVHAISELSFAGAAAGLLFGIGVVEGSLVGSLTAALLPFGLGLGILCLSLYSGRVANKFGLLTGQIVAVDNPRLVSLLIICSIVIAGLLAVWRPLMFVSIDAQVAEARGVRSIALSMVFMILLGLVTAVSVQIVGALLVLSVLVTPAAAALRVSASPLLVPVLSTLFAVVAMVGGIMLALGGSVPISPYVTTISFLIYLACRAWGALQNRPPKSARVAAAA